MLVSSIVPPMGRLKRTALVSNAALRAVCSREKVAVVDNTDAFTARSGAPRKHLYRDQVHPSDSGTNKLVSNLQLATGFRRPQASSQASYNRPVSRPQQDQDTAQPRQRQERTQQHQAAIPSLLGPVPSRYTPYTQHYRPTYWNSWDRQRATVPQRYAEDLYCDRLNTTVFRQRPLTPPGYRHSVYPTETLVYRTM